MQDVLEEEIKVINGMVKPDEHVICALSGGVDSTVAATPVHKAISYRLHYVFVDNGLLRHQTYIGKVKQTVFHTQKTGRRRVVVSTKKNIIASLDLRRGDIFWQHVLGKNDHVDQIDIALGKYVTLSSEGSTLRARNLPDGLLVWETVLQVSTLSKPLLYVSENNKLEVSLIPVFGGGWLHAISSVDGEIIWKKEFSSEGLHMKVQIGIICSREKICCRYAAV